MYKNYDEKLVLERVSALEARLFQAEENIKLFINNASSARESVPLTELHKLALEAVEIGFRSNIKVSVFSGRWAYISAEVHGSTGSIPMCRKTNNYITEVRKVYFLEKLLNYRCAFDLNLQPALQEKERREMAAVQLKYRQEREAENERAEKMAASVEKQRESDDLSSAEKILSMEVSQFGALLCWVYFNTAVPNVLAALRLRATKSKDGRDYLGILSLGVANTHIRAMKEQLLRQMPERLEQDDVQIYFSESAPASLSYFKCLISHAYSNSSRDELFYNYVSSRACKINHLFHVEFPERMYCKLEFLSAIGDSPVLQRCVLKSRHAARLADEVLISFVTDYKSVMTLLRNRHIIRSESLKNAIAAIADKWASARVAYEDWVSTQPSDEAGGAADGAGEGAF